MFISFTTLGFSFCILRLIKLSFRRFYPPGGMDQLQRSQVVKSTLRKGKNCNSELGDPGNVLRPGSHFRYAGSCTCTMPWRCGPRPPAPSFPAAPTAPQSNCQAATGSWLLILNKGNTFSYTNWG